MNWRFWRKQYQVSVMENEYNIKIVKRMSADGKLSMEFFDYVKQEFNANRKWSWKTEQNYLVFDNQQDFVTFLLKMS